MHTEKELELAKRYLEGDCNDIQFNYIVSTEKLDRNRIERLMEQINYNGPMVAAAKMMLLYIMLHFVFCFVYSLFIYIQA
jgi:hypothetical protein